MRLNYLLCLSLFFIFACGDDEPECNPFQAPVNFDQIVEADNIRTIEEYLDTTGLTAQVTESNLYYVTIEEGGSAKPDECSSVLASYTGYLPDGTVFDMSNESGTVFSLSQVILGWQEGMQLFGVDGEGTLLIPSKLAYGSSPPPNSGIPENSVLIFDIKLLGF